MYRNKDSYSWLEDHEERLQKLEHAKQNKKKFKLNFTKFKEFFKKLFPEMIGFLLLGAVVFIVWLSVVRVDRSSTCSTICNSNSSFRIKTELENDDLICTCVKRGDGTVFTKTIEGYDK